MKPIFAATAAFACLVGGAHADTTITYGSWAPSSDPASQAMAPFAAEVKEKSGGRISFETHFDSTVVQMRTSIAGIRDGLVDAGYVTGSIYQAEMPIDAMLTQYASIKANPYSISGASTDLALNDCDDCLAEAKANGLLPLAYAGTPHFYLMCKNPVTSFDQLKGKSIRAASANLRLADRIGATPVNTPTVEVLEAMQKGQVECAIGSIFWLQAYSLWDVVRYVVDIPVGQYNNGLVFGVNPDFWADLADEDKTAIVSSLPTLVAQAAAIGAQAAEELRAASIEKGVVWGEPTPEMEQFLDEWFASERAAVQAWGEQHGIKNAGPILDKFEAAVVKWNKIAEETGGDPQKFRDALEREVYSKL